MTTKAVIATKMGMTQAWTTAGKRLAVTRCVVEPLHVVAEHKLSASSSSIQNQPTADQPTTYFEVGYGLKKHKNMDKPLRAKLTKSGFSFGVIHLRGMQLPTVNETAPAVGATLKLGGFLEVGDVVKVQGTSKGRGFAGAVKRHGFKGVGSRTHGQSDRERAVGSIGSGTTPGRVLKGKRMPGHFGTETKTVGGLVVVYVNPNNQEVWISGPVPGANDSFVTINKTGDKREIELDLQASGLQTPTPETVEPTSETETAPQSEPTAEPTQPATTTQETKPSSTDSEKATA